MILIFNLLINMEFILQFLIFKNFITTIINFHLFQVNFYKIFENFIVKA